MEISKETKLNTLYDHYKETVGYLKTSINIRDRHVYYLLVIVSLIVIQTASPEFYSNAINSLITKYLNCELHPSAWIINNILLFTLLCVAHRYYQVTIVIERSYPYIHLLEKNISKFTNDIHFITRESRSYLKGFPCFSKWTHWLYTYVIPILIVLILLIKARIELLPTAGYYVSIGFIIMTCISTFLYLIFRATQKEVFVNKQQ